MNPLLLTSTAKGIRLAALLLAVGASLPCLASDPAELSYREFVQFTNLSKTNKELRAFVQGVSYGLRVEFVCGDKVTDLLRKPDAMIDELLQFSRTDWGKLYLVTEGTFGIARYPMTVGDVLYRYVAEHSGCQRVARGR